jgi:transposase-like protein
MMKKRFEADFKSRVALEALKGGKTIAEISSDYKVHSTQIAKWKRQALTGIKEFFSHGTQTHAEESDREMGDLYAQIGKLKVENDFLKKTVYPH